MYSNVEILVYSDGGVGASSSCVTMTVASLKKAVSKMEPSYAVRTTDSTELVGSKWSASCQLLVMPGGRDAPYCKELDGVGNKQIRAFVEAGGGYLGICAGAYYGSAYVEFAKGDPNIEIVGPRELAFFPVTSVGPVFPGFNYDNNAGAHVAGMSVTKAGEAVLGTTGGSNYSSLYYNGGCYFERRQGGVPNGTPHETTHPYNILATFTGRSEPRPTDMTTSVSGCPAIIGGHVGSGKVVLTGLHFEASPALLSNCYADDEYVTSLLPMLRLFEPQREDMFASCVRYLLSTSSSCLHQCGREVLQTVV